VTVASFVAYKVPVVAQALARATRRGVTVRLILEDPDVSRGKVAFSALRALGEDVAAASQIYVWPVENRPQDPYGNHGSLHAKCAVADSAALLISSANLTDHAFHLNIELGVLVHGGDLPARAAQHWTSLIASGTLQRI
jgi:phosphatidylserine/phosphatidylglycerophosphate/cardiolipin synthase-like enzyme